MATLKVKDKLWNYLPNTDRTMRVPSAMMSGAYMGSHITNDDLVQGTRLSDDYLFEPGAAGARRRSKDDPLHPSQNAGRVGLC